MASNVSLSIIHLRPVPAQEAQVILGGQNCLIRVYHKSTGMFFDLLVNGEPIVLGRICQDRNRLVRYARLPFSGDLFFVDSQGEDDPFYTGLGDRFNLFYAAAP